MTLSELVAHIEKKSHKYAKDWPESNIVMMGEYFVTLFYSNVEIMATLLYLCFKSYLNCTWIL
jgi:hypothetical protein